MFSRKITSKVFNRSSIRTVLLLKKKKLPGAASQMGANSWRYNLEGEYNILQWEVLQDLSFRLPPG